jgi:hypothetical protein
MAEILRLVRQLEITRKPAIPTREAFYHNVFDQESYAEALELLPEMQEEQLPRNAKLYSVWAIEPLRKVLRLGNIIEPLPTLTVPAIASILALGRTHPEMHLTSGHRIMTIVRAREGYASLSFFCPPRKVRGEPFVWRVFFCDAIDDDVTHNRSLLLV